MHATVVVCNDMNFLLETKQMLTAFVYIKDLGNAFLFSALKFIMIDQNDKQRAQMKKVSYASVVGSLIVLGRYLKKSSIGHWQVVKRVMSCVVKDFISKFHLVESISMLLTIYCDNSIVVCLSQNNKNFKQLKQFDTKYTFVREKVQKFQIHVEHIPKELMVLYPLTNDLLVKIFVDHVTHMDVVRYI
ncbi:hypothetical protein CR513_47303, partial [Mucuna pruriens]